MINFERARALGDIAADLNVSRKVTGKPVKRRVEILPAPTQGEDSYTAGLQFRGASLRHHSDTAYTAGAEAGSAGRSYAVTSGIAQVQPANRNHSCAAADAAVDFRADAGDVGGF